MLVIEMSLSYMQGMANEDLVLEDPCCSWQDSCFGKRALAHASVKENER